MILKKTFTLSCLAAGAQLFRFPQQLSSRHRGGVQAQNSARQLWTFHCVLSIFSKPIFPLLSLSLSRPHFCNNICSDSERLDDEVEEILKQWKSSSTFPSSSSDGATSNSNSVVPTAGPAAAASNSFGFGSTNHHHHQHLLGSSSGGNGYANNSSFNSDSKGELAFFCLFVVLCKLRLALWSSWHRDGCGGLISWFDPDFELNSVVV